MMIGRVFLRKMGHSTRGPNVSAEQGKWKPSTRYTKHSGKAKKGGGNGKIKTIPASTPPSFGKNSGKLTISVHQEKKVEPNIREG